MICRDDVRGLLQHSYRARNTRDINAPLPGSITSLTPNGIRPDPTKGEIYRYEASGQFNQRQVFIGFNRVNERPSFAGPNADCASPTIRCTRFGNFNLVPLPGEVIIPRNYGQSPGTFVVNLRVSRSFAFVNRGNSAAARPQGQSASGGFRT